ncbi:1,3,6,8-tetrahydroxynaphthalene synthase [Amycolatopsis pretoriensis]|uniref:1,3,6,8-tetrahydroxynaphthalene synthase n=1 Tax=Amycolatopsis pretoriensis TaxID=218821 RepID=A0A1H5QNP5_9PSEU|nr:type III polyketide synthase [Amycolatopsis pretoriensis]SEF27685.1 1,3,6,8-tetrahydroxynaphthalene synthase [Amycolatopsis pretoriensis]
MHDVVFDIGDLSPTLCRPAVWVPDNVITLDETLAMCRRIHSGHQKLRTVLRMIENTGVQKRHLIQPITATLDHPGVTARAKIYQREVRQNLPAVVEEALQSADVQADDIDAIVFVSCTGFTMPPMTTWMINELGFRQDVRQIPMAQLGCAAGGAAVNRAHDFCRAYPGANVLVVTCEFCSLCYQPTDSDVGTLLSNGLFGDAIAAAVVRGAGGAGMTLSVNSSYVVPETESWISYEIKDTGYHFRLDRRVPGTMSMITPALKQLTASNGWDASNLGFYVIHAGGPRILDDLAQHLAVPAHAFRHSRAVLSEYGNIASAVVLAVLRHFFDEGLPAGAQGMLAGFGPGITAEAALGTWTPAVTRQDPHALPNGTDREAEVIRVRSVVG